MTDAPLTAITVTVNAADHEAALVGAWQVAGGCEERDRSDGRVDLVFWVPASDAVGVCDVLRALPGLGSPHDVVAAPADEAWRTALRDFHQPIQVGDLLYVRPPWVPQKDGLADVVIDPGMAFGTGQHATTRGCLELLCLMTPGPLVDVGCGSGVLAIAAARLGFAPITAIDFDPLCVDATLDNARENRVDIAVEKWTLGDDPVPDAERIAANLTAHMLVQLAGELKGRPPREAVLSGLRPADVDRVMAAWRPLGMEIAERRDADDWSALLVRA